MPEQDKKEGPIGGERTFTPSSDEAVSERLDQLQREISGVVNAPSIDIEAFPPTLITVGRKSEDTELTKSNVPVPMGWGANGRASIVRRVKLTVIGLKSLKAA